MKALFCSAYFCLLIGLRTSNFILVNSANLNSSLLFRFCSWRFVLLLLIALGNPERWLFDSLCFISSFLTPIEFLTNPGVVLLTCPLGESSRRFIVLVWFTYRGKPCGKSSDLTWPTSMKCTKTLDFVWCPCISRAYEWVNNRNRKSEAQAKWRCSFTIE